MSEKKKPLDAGDFALIGLSVLALLAVAVEDQRADEARKERLRKKYARIWGIF